LRTCLSARRVLSLVEVQSWILSFGCQAEVLEPAALGESMREEMQRALEAYESGDPRKQPARR